MVLYYFFLKNTAIERMEVKVFKSALNFLWKMRQKLIVVNERNDSGYNPGRVEQKLRYIFKELSVAAFCLKR